MSTCGGLLHCRLTQSELRWAPPLPRHPLTAVTRTGSRQCENLNSLEKATVARRGRLADAMVRAAVAACVDLQAGILSRYDLAQEDETPDREPALVPADGAESCSEAG